MVLIRLVKRAIKEQKVRQRKRTRRKVLSRFEKWNPEPIFGEARLSYNAISRAYSSLGYATDVSMLIKADIDDPDICGMYWARNNAMLIRRDIADFTYNGKRFFEENPGASPKDKYIDTIAHELAHSVFDKYFLGKTITLLQDAWGGGNTDPGFINFELHQINDAFAYWLGGEVTKINVVIPYSEVPGIEGLFEKVYRKLQAKTADTGFRHTLDHALDVFKEVLDEDEPIESRIPGNAG